MLDRAYRAPTLHQALFYWLFWASAEAKSPTTVRRLNEIREALRSIDVVGLRKEASVARRKLLFSVKPREFALGEMLRLMDVQLGPGDPAPPVVDELLLPLPDDLPLRLPPADDLIPLARFGVVSHATERQLPRNAVLDLQLTLAVRADIYDVWSNNGAKAVTFRLRDLHTLPNRWISKPRLDSFEQHIDLKLRQSGYPFARVKFGDHWPGAISWAVLPGVLSDIRTVAFSKRFPPGARFNRPEHRAILENSPVKPQSTTGALEAPVLRERPLFDYARRLSSVPGQRVHLAASYLDETGGVVLDFLVFGDDFKMPEQ